MVKKKKNSLLKDKRLKYGILVAGLALVVLLGGSTFYSAFGSYNLGYGTNVSSLTTVGADGSVSEADLIVAGDTLYLYIFSEGWLEDSSTTPIPELDNSVCDLVSVDNDVVVDSFSPRRKVTSLRDEQVHYFEIKPYFVVEMDGVYQGEHTYTLVVRDGLEGSTYNFNITGDVTSPEYPTDGGDDGEVPTLPEFVSTPEDTMTIFSNETVTITWVVADDNPASYELYQNGTLAKVGVASGDEFPFDALLDNLDAGVYEYEFIFVDADGNELSHTTIVTVTGDGLDYMTLGLIGIGLFLLIGGGGGATYVVKSR